MTTDTRHDREGRSLIEAAAIARELHANGSGPLVRALQVQLSRALAEYADRRQLDLAEIAGDVDVAAAVLRSRLEEDA